MSEDNQEANNVPSVSIANVLGIPSAVEPVNVDQTNEAETDYEFAQKGIKAALASGEAALDEMYQIAVSSQNARAFEVYGQLLEKILNGHRTLIETKAKNASIDTGERVAKQKVVNNNLFVGTTKDLQDFIKNRKKGEE